MDFIDFLKEEEDAGIFEEFLPYRNPVWRRRRADPLLDIPNDREFKSRYRFVKHNVRRLVDMCVPIFNIKNNRRGLPCSAEQIVCSALEIMAGGHFFRVNGYAGGLCTGTAWKNLYRYLLNCFLMGE